MSDTEPEDDSDNKDDGILNAFTTIVNPTKGIVEDVDEEKELVMSKFEKMDDHDDIHTTYEKLYKLSKKHEKLYRLAIKKLSDMELDHVELFQVRAYLERTSSTKLNEMLSHQKSASDQTGLGYDFSSSNTASTNTTIFCSSL